MNLKRFRIVLLASLASLLAGLSSPSGAIDTVNPQDAVIGPFGGLNTTDSPAIIGANQAQDLLNVDVTPNGKSVRKRQGFALDTTLTYSSSPVHGMYKFFDANGNEVRLAGQDLGLYASVSGASWVRVATGTLTASWQCTDYLGIAYCVTSSRDTPVKTDGTVAGTSYTAIPAGTLIMSTPDRLVVGNTAANPSRLSYSGSVNFTDFTVGSAITSSSYEDIAAPGSQLTHLAYHYGRWLWWKNQSFGFITGTDQTNLDIKTVSDTIGTFDNTDIFWEGMTYFRGSDNQIYAYDGAVLTPISRDITPTVNSANRRKANLWTQSSQSDFATGSAQPLNALSTSITPGAVTPSTMSITDTLSADFGQGTGFGTGIDTYTVSGAVTLRQYLNDGFSSFANWTSENAGVYTNGTMSASGGNMVCSTAGGCQAVSTQTVNADFGIQMTAVFSGLVGGQTELAALNNSRAGYGIFISMTNPPTAGMFEYSDFSDHSAGLAVKCSVSTVTITTGDQLTLTHASGGAMVLSRNGVFLCGATDTTVASFTNLRAYCSGATTYKFDDVIDAAGAGNFTSRAFDTQFSTPVWGTFGATLTSTGTYAFSARAATTAGGTYTTDTAISTSTRINVSTRRYLIYSSTLTIGGSASVLPQLQDVTVVAASTGSYYSAVNNASALSAWSSLGINDATVGASTITYYVRASTGSFTVLSSTPNWTLQAKNGTVNYSTGTYMQLRADFNITSATEAPTVNDFTFNWFEGNAADKMYGTYYDYGLWFAVSLGTTTSNNNRVLRYDLLNSFWTVYDVASNGFLTYNNALYFGSTTAGKIYRFGGNVYSDDGSNINSYWKSKDFFAGSPFHDEDLRTLSWYVKESSNTLNISYIVNGSSASTYNVNAYSATKSTIRANRNFPVGTLANTVNFQFGDNSALDLWEVFAGAYTYVIRPWNATQ